MRRLVPILLLLMVGCRGREPDTDIPHPGEPVVHQRSALSDSLPREVRFLERMLQHQQALWHLLQDAGSRELSPRSLRIVEQANWQRQQQESDLVNLRERYPGGVHLPRTIRGDGTDELRDLQGEAYEKALLSALLADYRAEVAEIDSFLPHLNADVKGLAKEIRSQRLHEIEKLAPHQ